MSGDSIATLDLVDKIYSKVTTTYRAKSIRVAEAAKVVENVQRDINIAVMNELSHIFSRLDINTYDVINAAATKFNFHKYQPGLVGGHCISVDPYYLAERAAQAGYIPSLIHAAREVNDRMPVLISQKTLKALSAAKTLNADTIVTVLGVTFKENVPDIRNSKVVDMIRELEAWNVTVQVVDAYANAAEVKHEYGFELCTDPKPADAIILAVAHDQYTRWSDIKHLMKKKQNGVLIDVKNVVMENELPDNVSYTTL